MGETARARVGGLITLIIFTKVYCLKANVGLHDNDITASVLDTPGYTTESAGEIESQNTKQELDAVYRKVTRIPNPLTTTGVLCDNRFMIKSYEEVLHQRYLKSAYIFQLVECKITWIFRQFPEEQSLMIYAVTTVPYDALVSSTPCQIYVTFTSGVSENNTDRKFCTSDKGFIVEVTSSPMEIYFWVVDDALISITYLHFFLRNKTETATESTPFISTKQTDLTQDQTSIPNSINPCGMRNPCPDRHECITDNTGEHQCVCINGLCEEEDSITIILATAIPGVIVFTVIVVWVWWKGRHGRIRKTKEVPFLWRGTILNDRTAIKERQKVPSLTPTLTKVLHKDVQQQLIPLLISPERTQIQDELGRGAFGTVYKGRYNPDDNPFHVQTVAIKALSDTCIGTDINAFVNEALTMAEFNHCHVMSIIGVCINPQTDDPMIVLPFMENGDLKTYLWKFRYEKKDIEPPDENQLLMFCLHIARGMDYLSGLKFVHRDLAARNCMVDGNLVVKVADFGLTRDVYTEAYYRQDQQKLLPVKWMAIESLVDRVFTTYSDIWSFGVTMWEVLTLAMLPYPEMDNADVINHVKAGKRMELPETCPEEFHPLMRSCWEENPTDRPSFIEIANQISTYLAMKCDYLDLSDECIVTGNISIDAGMTICSSRSDVPEEHEENTDSKNNVEFNIHSPS